MIADQPVVNYKSSDDTKSKKEMDDLADAWAERRKGKLLAGEKIKLSDYIKNNNI